jgi:hypothetical protein
VKDDRKFYKNWQVFLLYAHGGLLEHEYKLPDDTYAVFDGPAGAAVRPDSIPYNNTNHKLLFAPDPEDFATEFVSEVDDPVGML